MASVPSFDPNTFIPSISSNDWKDLTQDEANPLVNRGEMMLRKVQHVGAWRLAGPTQFEDFADFIEREPKCLRLLDETQFLNRRIRVMPVTGSRAWDGSKQSHTLVVPNRRCAETSSSGDIPDTQTRHLHSRHPQVDLRVKRQLGD